jgi:hypothetical protein
MSNLKHRTRSRQLAVEAVVEWSYDADRLGDFIADLPVDNRLA